MESRYVKYCTKNSEKKILLKLGPVEIRINEMLSSVDGISPILVLLAAAICTAAGSSKGEPKWRQLRSFVARENCGISKVVVQDADRIVGGREAIEGEFPWQASLRFKTSFMEPIHLCGAAILNEWYILTAAHCVDGRMAENLEVAVGVYEQDEKGRFFSSHSVAKIISHEKFDHEYYRNDIALLKLKSSISLDDSDGFVNSICLPNAYKKVTGITTAAGWGSTAENGAMSDTLRAVDIPIVPYIVCSALFGGGGIIAKNMLCAGRPTGGIDTCQGDSGGPLIQRDQSGRAFVVGIVSWGVGCARRGYPGVYASVPSYIDWIMSHMD